MSTFRMIAAAGAAAILVGLAGAATAAPVGALTGAGEALKSEVQTAVEPVHYRCWWHPYRGKVCAWERPRVYGFYYDAPRHHGHWGWRGRW